MLTAARARELLCYSAETGLLTWRVARHRRVKAGDAAGGTDASGYSNVRVDGVLYRAHRVAWLIVTGAFPETPLDHTDGDRSNNAWVNLRTATPAANSQNLRKAHKDSASGLLGVSRNSTRWRATIYTDGKHKHLGNFASPDAAHDAYVVAKRKLHEGCTI